MDVLTNAGQELLFSRTFHAPRHLVWEAWTDPKHLSRWWGPDGFTASVERLDLRVGGGFLLTMLGPDGRSWPCKGVYREITPPSRLIFEGEAADDHPCGGGLPPGATITISFLEAAGRTTVTIKTLLGGPAAREEALAGGFREGWAETFAHLEMYLRSLT